MNEFVHKQAAASDGTRRPVALCGQYGYTALRWRRVTCEVCLHKRGDGYRYAVEKRVNR